VKDEGKGREKEVGKEEGGIIQAYKRNKKNMS
jgi:hypothetical protein